MSQITPRNKMLIGALTLQQTLIGIMGLAFTVAVFRQSGYSPIFIAHKLQLVLFAYAVGTMIQIFNLRVIGSGIFLPPVSAAIYVQPSILALSVGGLPLLIGMTLFAGFCEFIFSFIIRRTRFIFPPEICGLVILLVGLELALSGFRTAIQPNYVHNILICIVTLVPIISMSVWVKRYIRHLSSFFGVVLGGYLTYYFGDNNFLQVMQHTTEMVNTFSLPPLFSIFATPIHFNWGLAIPFLLVGFAASIRSLGLAIGVQQFENPHWHRPHYQPIARALRSDGITAMLSGLLGTPGLNISPTATTMAIAARCTDVLVGVGMSILFLIFSCFPKFLLLVSNAPLAIVGAILIYYAAFIFTGGVRVIGAQAFGIKQVFSIGIPFCLAVSATTYQSVFHLLPPLFSSFAESPLAIGIVSAIILNLIFQVGSYRHQSFNLKNGNDTREIVRNNIHNYGDAWALKNDMVEDAILIANEVVEQVYHADLASSDINVEIINHPTCFKMKFTYKGEPFKMQSVRKIDASQILDEETFISGLKIYLRGTYPEEVNSKARGEECEITMTFNYY